jgi:hypothetical protein
LSRSAKIKQNVLITASAAPSNLFRLAPYFHNKCQKTQLDLFIVNTQEAKSGNQLRRITAGCMIVFEMFLRNGDGTFYVAVKIGGDSKIMLGLGAISFDKSFTCCKIIVKARRQRYFQK